MAHYPRIYGLRKSAGLSQEELAEQLGLHRTAYVLYELGLYDPPASVLYDLAVFYNISCNYILGLTDTPAPLK